MANANYKNGRLKTSLIAAMIISLYEAANRLMDEQILIHPSLVDVLAREVLDFPLEKQSLCAFLDKSRIAAAIRQSPVDISQDLVEISKSMLTRKHDFYLNSKMLNLKINKCDIANN